MPSQPFQLRLVGLYHGSLGSLYSYFRFLATYWKALSNSTCLGLSFLICKNVRFHFYHNTFVLIQLWQIQQSTQNSAWHMASTILTMPPAVQGTRQQYTFVINHFQCHHRENCWKASSSTQGKKNVCKHLSLPVFLSFPFFPLHTLQPHGGLGKWTLKAQEHMDMVLIPFVQTSSMMRFCFKFKEFVMDRSWFLFPLHYLKLSCSLIAHIQNKGMWNKLFQPGSFT